MREYDYEYVPVKEVLKLISHAWEVRASIEIDIQLDNDREESETRQGKISKKVAREIVNYHTGPDGKVRCSYHDRVLEFTRG